MKALILYPMNALANDQAQRLAELLTSAPGAGRRHRRALHRRRQGRQRTKVTADGLITDRGDHPRQRRRTSCSPTTRCSTSCCCAHDDQRSVAAERDAACSTWCSTSSTPTTARRAPTSRCCCAASASRSRATGGRRPDAHRRRPGPPARAHHPGRHLGHARRRGRPGGDARTSPRPSSATTSTPTRSSPSPGSTSTSGSAAPPTRRRARTDAASIRERDARRAASRPSTRSAHDPDGARRSPAPSSDALYDEPSTLGDASPTPTLLLDARQGAPARPGARRERRRRGRLDDLAAALFAEPSTPPTAASGARGSLLTARRRGAQPRPGGRRPRRARRSTLHLWVRELTRIDRARRRDRRVPLGRRRRRRSAGDDAEDGRARPSRPSTAGTAAAPAGASGSRPVGDDLDADDDDIRRNHATRRGPVPRPAPRAGRGRARAESGDRRGPSRRRAALVLASERRVLLDSRPTDDDPDLRDGWVLPVLTHVGRDADDDSQRRHLPVLPADGRHPVPRQRHRHPAVGVAVDALRRRATSTRAEKKALVFTDSVQDAAHRAGFVQSRRTR